MLIRCCVCGSYNVTRGKFIAANGAIQIRDICNECKSNANGKAINVPHDQVDNIDFLPILEDYRSPLRPCARCGEYRRGVEVHHWAPRYIFKWECNDWPTSDLCLKCHREWHDTIEEYYRVKYRAFKV